jgi:hypothetical protein
MGDSEGFDPAGGTITTEGTTMGASEGMPGGTVAHRASVGTGTPEGTDIGASEGGGCRPLLSTTCVGTSEGTTTGAYGGCRTPEGTTTRRASVSTGIPEGTTMGSSEGEGRSPQEGIPKGAFGGVGCRASAGYKTPDGTTMGEYEGTAGDNMKDVTSASTGAVDMMEGDSASIGTGGHDGVSTLDGAVTMPEWDSASIRTGTIRLGSIADKGAAAWLAWIGLGMMGVDDFDDAFRRVALLVAMAGFNTGDNIHSPKPLLLKNKILYFDLTGAAHCDRSGAHAQRQVKVYATCRLFTHTPCHTTR